MNARNHRILVPTLTAVLVLGLADLAAAQPCFTAPTAPTSYWKADGNGFDSTGGRDATLVFGAIYGAGLSGQAFELDGDNDYAEASHDAALNFGSGDFTIGVWVKFRTTDGEQVMLEKWDQGGGPVGWTLTKLGGNVVRFAMTDDVNLDSGALTIPTDTWMHFAVKRSGSTCTMFLDGTSIATASSTNDLDSTVGVKFGTREGTAYLLDGWIDEVQIFADTALSDTDIQGIHAAGGSGTCVVAVCGDGATQLTEECDDGNVIPGDGCENDCTLSCGDGAITGAEVCDDGNLVDGDGCDSNCTPTACGNGAVSSGTGEECDDSGLVDGDGCDSNCTFTDCGNGVLTEETGEHCDDGNAVDGDGCEASCTYSSISVDLPPGGGEVSSDPMGLGATPGVPSVITFQTTNGGTVTIGVETGDVSVNGAVVVGASFSITAPPATAADPIVITFVLDGSIIAPGVDLSQFQGLRNGIPLLDCVAPVAATPDPCLASLIVNVDGDIEILMRTSAASLWQVGLRGLNSGEQGCANAINSAGLKVAKARAKVASTCRKNAAKGSELDAQSCLTSDPSGKVGKLAAKTTSIESGKCTDAPPFAFTAAMTANTAAEAAAVGLVADLFGANLTTAVLPDTNKAGSKCQAAVLKASQKLFDTKAKLVLACFKSALAGEPELSVSGTDLAECFARAAEDPKDKIAKSLAKVTAAVDGACTGVTLSTTFPGSCSAAADVPACIDARSECRVCTAFDGMDDLAADCDTVDDGLDNGSCP